MARVTPPPETTTVWNHDGETMEVWPGRNYPLGATWDGRGVNVIYDNIANPDVLPKAFHALGMNGRLVTAGAQLPNEVLAGLLVHAAPRHLPALGMKFGYQMPNTDQARGIGTNQINIFSKIIVQKKFGLKPGKSPMANIYANIGLGIMNAPLNNFTQNDVLLYGLAGIFR